MANVKIRLYPETVARMSKLTKGEIMAGYNDGKRFLAAKNNEFVVIVVKDVDLDESSDQSSDQTKDN